MAFSATVTPGWSYTTGDTATASNLNALGNPAVVIPDNQLYVVNAGSLSQPGVSVNGDANTGWGQLAGADTLSGVAGGTEVMRLTSTQVGFANGTAAAPSVTFIGDGNTGFNHDSGDEIDVVCGGSVVSTFGTTGLTVTGAVNATSMAVSGVSVKTAGISKVEFSYAHDFLGAVAASGMDTAVTATGTVAQVTGSGDPDWRGLVGLNVSAVSDRAVLSTPMNLAIGGLFRVRMKLGASTGGVLSTGTERYYVIIGTVHVTTETLSSATASGVWFQYDDSASSQWQTVTRKNGTKELQNTAVNVVASETYFTLEARRIGSEEYHFYINGTLATTHTASAPSSASNYFAVILEKSIGSTLRGIAIDSVEIVNPLTRT